MELTVTHPRGGMNCINHTSDYYFFTYENRKLHIDIEKVEVPEGRDTKCATSDSIYGATTERECIEKKIELGLT